MSRLVETSADPESAARLVEEQFSTVRRNTPGMIAANICNALVLVATFWRSPMFVTALLWAGAVIGVAVYIYLRPRLRSPAHASARQYSGLCRRATINAVLLGTLWALVPILFFPAASAGARLMIACLTAGMMFGGAFTLASAPLAATAFAAPIALAAAATLLSTGDPDHLRIVIVLAVYLAALLRAVFVNAENLKKRLLTQIAAEQQARTDALTGLPNRLGFTDAIEREFARISRKGEGFLLLCIDLDDFKAINDRLGHLAGDQLLTQAAKRMRACLRGSDFVARLGGDEFAIIATDISDAEFAGALAGRIVDCYDDPFALDGREVVSGASVGGALAPRDGADPRELMKSADIALYRAKQRRGVWRLFEPTHDVEAREEKSLENDLRRAVALRQLTLVFQPILDVETSEIVGCEALSRWTHPTRGAVEPSVFIPLAERIGLIHDIGFWVVEEASAAAARLPPDFRVALNVSPLQLRRPDFAERVLEALTFAQVAPCRFEFEITETALLADDEASDCSIRKLSRAGISVSLDDFGSGYSSLSYLRKLPLQKVKIDRSFVKDVLIEKDCAAIVVSVTRLALDLEMTIIAEGVETIEQLQWLQRVGCNEAQGYLISRPLPQREFEAFLAGWRPESLARAQSEISA